MNPSKPPADWTNEFFKHLIEQSGRVDWAPRGSGFWADFRKALARTGCSWAQAEEALSIVCDRPKLFPSDWRPAIIEEVIRIKSRDVAAGLLGDGTTRADLERACRDCPECGGTGSSARFVHNPQHPAGRGSKHMGYCGSCDLGRFFAGANKRSTWADAPGLAYRPNLPQLHHPDDWDAEAGRPRETEFCREFSELVEANRAGNVPGGFAMGLRRLLAGRLSRSTKDRPAGPPGPPPEPTAQPPRAWRRDPAAPRPDPLSTRAIGHPGPPVEQATLHPDPPPV